MTLPNTLSAAQREITALRARLAIADEVANSLADCVDALPKPDERLCCDGQECGCQGSTVHQRSIHYANSALAAYHASGKDAA